MKEGMKGEGKERRERKRKRVSTVTTLRKEMGGERKS